MNNFIRILFQGLFATGFVLLMEMYGPEQRALVGSLLNVIWGFSMTTLALVAYLLPNWRHMQLFMSVILLLALPFYKQVLKYFTLLFVKNVRGFYLLNVFYTLQMNTHYNILVYGTNKCIQIVVLSNFVFCARGHFSTRNCCVRFWLP